MAQTLHCPRHHAVDASAFATSSSICMKTSSGSSAPPALVGNRARYKPFSIRAETTGGVSRRVLSISSASRAIMGASARARSIRSNPGTLFMPFLATVAVLLSRYAGVRHPSASIKLGTSAHQAKQNENGPVQQSGRLGIDAADHPPDPVAPKRHHFVGHDLRPHQ